MPIIDKGTHRCEKCSRVFEWEYFEPLRNHRSQSLYQAERLPDPKRAVRKVWSNDPGYRKNCPYCGHDNEIRSGTAEEHDG